MRCAFVTWSVDLNNGSDAASVQETMAQDAVQLESFLRKRRVPDRYLSRMLRDHIDATVIEFMDDDTLASYIPTYGDRIAARRFIMEHKGASKGEKESKKFSLFEKLKKKMGIDVDDDDNHEEENEGASAAKQRTYAKNNRWAEKKTRKVELGWIHDGKQVRKRKGGGTRTLDMPKDSKKVDILRYAKDLFFPDGRSKFGRFDACSHDILDFQEEAVLDDNITVGELYTVLKMGMLRFYLCTKSLPNEDDKEDGNKNDEEDDVQLVDKHQEDDYLTQTVVILSTDLTEGDTDVFSDTEVVFGPSLGDPTDSQLDDTLIHDPDLQFVDNEPVITFSTLPPTCTADNPPEAAFVSDAASTSTASYEVVTITIKLHRVNLLEEMISQFKNAGLLKHPLKYTYVDEKGADADGVSRDVYAAFWAEFMEHTAEGEDLRVPLLSPKWQEEEWKSIGRILLKGFKDHGYYPCRLAPVFTVALIFGEGAVTDGMLYESLLQFISQSDRDLITTALTEDLVGEDRDELLDLLDRMDVTVLPTQANLKDILLKVAHKQLIQKPRYAAEKMSMIAGQFLKDAFVSPQDVLRMYDDKKPTTRKFLKLLDASPTSQAENQSFRFLQQYIRGLDDTGLGRLLRFLTGSDIICVNKIEVLFTPTVGLARRPVAHTCGPVLELPFTYTVYPELRTEMDNILASESSFNFSIV